MSRMVKIFPAHDPRSEPPFEFPFAADNDRISKPEFERHSPPGAPNTQGNRPLRDTLSGSRSLKDARPLGHPGESYSDAILRPAKGWVA
jgi:hypothetical protein